MGVLAHAVVLLAVRGAPFAIYNILRAERSSLSVLAWSLGYLLVAACAVAAGGKVVVTVAVSAMFYACVVLALQWLVARGWANIRPLETFVLLALVCLAVPAW